MGLTFTSLLSQVVTSTASQYSTSAWTPTDGRLYLLTVANFEGSGANAQPPTAQGNGMTWVGDSAGSAKFNANPAGNRVTVLRARVASGSSGGATVIDFSLKTQQDVIWYVTEVAGMDTSGTNGSGAIAQTVNAAGTASQPSVSLATFGDAVNNAAFVVFGGTSNVALSANTGFTRLNVGAQSTAVNSMTEYIVSQNTDARSLTSIAKWGVVAVEIKAAASTSASGTDYYYRRRRMGV